MIDVEDKAVDVATKLTRMTLPRMLVLIDNQRTALMKMKEAELNLASGRLPMRYVCGVYNEPVSVQWIQDDLQATFDLNQSRRLVR